MTTRQMFFVIALVTGAIVLVGFTLFQWLSLFRTGSVADVRAGVQRGSSRSGSRHARLPGRHSPAQSGAVRGIHWIRGLMRCERCCSSTSFNEAGCPCLPGARTSTAAWTPCQRASLAGRQSPPALPRDWHRLRIATGRLSGSRPSAAQRAWLGFGPGMMLRDLLGVPGPLGLESAWNSAPSPDRWASMASR